MLLLLMLLLLLLLLLFVLLKCRGRREHQRRGAKVRVVCGRVVLRRGRRIEAACGLNGGRTAAEALAFEHVEL